MLGSQLLSVISFAVSLTMVLICIEFEGVVTVVLGLDNDNFTPSKLSTLNSISIQSPNHAAIALLDRLLRMQT